MVALTTIIGLSFTAQNSVVIFSIGLAIGKLVFGIPMRGNLLSVYFALMVYLLVVLGLGLWISIVTRTQQQAMFVPL
jgi:ABC-type transport system involved in multi-copper enzyme maturation permease subunit